MERATAIILPASALLSGCHSSIFKNTVAQPVFDRARQQRPPREDCFMRHLIRSMVSAALILTATAPPYQDSDGNFLIDRLTTEGAEVARCNACQEWRLETLKLVDGNMVSMGIRDYPKNYTRLD